MTDLPTSGEQRRGYQRRTHLATEPRTQLADTISALVDPYQHAETYTLTLRSAIPDGRPSTEIRVHRTTHASLLDQLASAVQPSFDTGASGLHGGYASKPTARLAAIDRLLAIDAGAGMWMLRIGGRLRETTAANCRALAGADMATPTLHELAKDAARWLTWAQIVTGWETPPRTLREPCPLCGIRGVIKVRADSEHVEGAWCTSCDQTWSDDAEIAMLAQHVRWCNGELKPDTPVLA